MSEIAQKKTPLYDEHVRRGARMISFGEWLMPVQYTSIVEEHHAVRKNVGIFDISHMGQFLVSGKGARDWLNTMLTNDIDKLEKSTVKYKKTQEYTDLYPWFLKAGLALVSLELVLAQTVWRRLP